MPFPSEGYKVGWDNDKLKNVSIALFPDWRTKKELLAYMREVGLTGWPNQSINVNHLHVTLFNTQQVKVPFLFKEQHTLQHPINLSGIKWKVGPFSSNVHDRSSIQILFPNVPRLKKLSELYHKQFKLAPNLDTYIFHMTLTYVQLFHPKSKAYEKTKLKGISDYLRLPPYTGRMVLDTIESCIKDSK